MPESNDHTKSLLHYKSIFISFEKMYRDTPVEERDPVIGDIMDKIEEAAEEKGAKILSGDDLRKVCVLHCFPIMEILRDASS